MIRYCVLAAALVLGASVAEAGQCKQANFVTGKSKSWSCKSGQICCSVPVLGYYGCGTNKLLGCVKI
jgi:hypothetical protein